MKRFVITAVLTVALSSFAFAGDIPSDGSPAPAPIPSAQAPTSPGEIPSDGLAGQISDAALSALLSVFALVV
jgi:opacity protein-like surface antigen